MNNCAICGQPMDLIPAGVSKTIQPIPAQPQYVPTPKANNTGDDIRQNVALKMVSELVSAGKIEKEEWRFWADTFNSYKPTDISEEEQAVGEQPPY